MLNKCDNLPKLRSARSRVFRWVLCSLLWLMISNAFWIVTATEIYCTNMHLDCFISKILVQREVFFYLSVFLWTFWKSLFAPSPPPPPTTQPLGKILAGSATAVFTSINCHYFSPHWDMHVWEVFYKDRWPEYQRSSGYQ